MNLWLRIVCGLVHSWMHWKWQDATIEEKAFAYCTHCGYVQPKPMEKEGNNV